MAMDLKNGRFKIKVELPCGILGDGFRQALYEERMESAKKKAKKQYAEDLLIEDAIIETDEIMGYKLYVDPTLEDNEIKMIGSNGETIKAIIK